MTTGNCKQIDLNDPATERIDDFVYIGIESEFTEGKGVCVRIDGNKIAIFKHQGRIGAIENTCVHMGGPLSDGEIHDGYVKCPFHGWSMDPFTGKAPHRFKGEDVQAYDVRVKDGKVYVSLTPRSGESLRKEEKEVGSGGRGYLEEWARGFDENEGSFYNLQQKIQEGKSETSAMGTIKPIIGWESIQFKGGQLFRMPMNADVAVNLRTVIGKTAKHPLVIDIPFYVSHMSFGALSREAKIALARGSATMGTAMCSGEGGMLPESRKEATYYIYELGTAMFSHKDDAIMQADAVEIKIGQAAKPGLGGHLPAGKMTSEIADIRGINKGTDSISPARHADVASVEDLAEEVAHLKELTGGKPIGIKFAAGHVEKDLEMALQADPDFITIDSRGGGTGAAPTFIKDNVSMPALFALHRARSYLDKVGSEVTLCITGGFREASDIAKALAMGADAVALATTSLVAIGCQRYRTCHTGHCPVGITTHDPELTRRFDIEKSAERFKGLYTLMARELETFARINGRDDIHKLDITDIITSNHEVSLHTDIEHM